MTGAQAQSTAASAVAQQLNSAAGGAPMTSAAAAAAVASASVSANAPGVTGAAANSAQQYLESANRPSQPIDSELLGERLEEISTQQGSPDAAEDPER